MTPAQTSGPRSGRGVRARRTDVLVREYARWRWPTGLAVAGLLAAGLAVAPVTPALASTTVTFGYTGGEQAPGPASGPAAPPPPR